MELDALTTKRDDKLATLALLLSDLRGGRWVSPTSVHVITSDVNDLNMRIAMAADEAAREAA